MIINFGTISHNCRSTQRTGVVGEWLQFCDGQTSAAGSGSVCDIVVQTAIDRITNDDSITLGQKGRRPEKSYCMGSICKVKVLYWSTGG